VCIHVCVSTCVYPRVCIHVCVSTCVYPRVCIHVCVSTCVYPRVCITVYRSASIACPHHTLLIHCIQERINRLPPAVKPEETKQRRSSLIRRSSFTKKRLNSTEKQDDTPDDGADALTLGGGAASHTPEKKLSAKQVVKARRRQSITMNNRVGYMHKRAIKSGRNWKRRYFILSQGVLSYYEDEFKVQKLNPKGEITIDAAATVEPDDEIIHCRKGIKLVTAGGVLYTSCDTEEERAAWIASLKAEIYTGAQAAWDRDKEHAAEGSGGGESVAGDGAGDGAGDDGRLDAGGDGSGGGNSAGDVQAGGVQAVHALPPDLEALSAEDLKQHLTARQIECATINDKAQLIEVGSTITLTHTHLHSPPLTLTSTHPNSHSPPLTPTHFYFLKPNFLTHLHALGLASLSSPSSLSSSWSCGPRCLLSQLVASRPRASIHG
jgi:hypothetical protein